MTKADVLAQLKTIIAEELDVNLEADEIDENVPLFEDGLGFDSIATVELISLIEKYFDVEFIDSELDPESFSNLNVLADFILRKKESEKMQTVA
ncbi:MAG: acyl carrier protein [Oscillatoria sp. PMC 1051.18]|nr:acyl carrier protein [Oscillatoria sp. PMC 1050.18]MEC5032449.1 acyl carrier protein [Oscillatoria sp. PMC 1051.18]